MGAENLVKNRDFVDISKDGNKLEYGYSKMAMRDIIDNTPDFDKKGDELSSIIRLNSKLEELSVKDPKKLAELEVVINNMINTGINHKLGKNIKNVSDLNSFFNSINLKNPDVLNIINKKDKETLAKNIPIDNKQSLGDKFTNYIAQGLFGGVVKRTNVTNQALAGNFDGVSGRIKN